MIVTQSNGLIDATKQVFLKLYDGQPNASDPSIFREDAAVIELLHPGQKPPALAFELRNNQLHYVADYQKYFPEVDTDLPRVEQEHFTDILIATGDLDIITNHLTRHPDSRRGVVSTWSPHYLLHPEQGGVCVTQLYFRLRDGELEVHLHSRANDAYRLLLMDMQLGTWAQQEVAHRLGVSTGRYIHFIDSIQLYRKHRSLIERQRKLMLSSSVWQ